jgi:hypothetical protein
LGRGRYIRFTCNSGGPLPNPICMLLDVHTWLSPPTQRPRMQDGKHSSDASVQVCAICRNSAGVLDECGKPLAPFVDQVGLVQWFVECSSRRRAAIVVFSRFGKSPRNLSHVFGCGNCILAFARQHTSWNEQLVFQPTLVRCLPFFVGRCEHKARSQHIRTSRALRGGGVQHVCRVLHTGPTTACTWEVMRLAKKRTCLHEGSIHRKPLRWTPCGMIQDGE